MTDVTPQHTPKAEDFVPTANDQILRPSGYPYFGHGTRVEKDGTNRVFYPASDAQNLILQFHRTFGEPASDFVTMLTDERFAHRIKMIESEIQELKDAIEAGDIVEIFDALIDIQVFVLGTLVEMGIDSGPGMAEVMRANMSKRMPDGSVKRSRGLEEDGEVPGKVMKGPNYQKPDMFLELVKQNWTPTYGEYLKAYGLTDSSQGLIDPSTPVSVNDEPDDFVCTVEAEEKPKFGVQSGKIYRDDVEIDLSAGFPVTIVDSKAFRKTE